MKKAVIVVAGQQFIVAANDKVQVNRLPDGTDKLELEPLMVFDENEVNVGTPIVKGAKVLADVIEAEVKGEKVRAIRFKAKKRVHKIRGQRPQFSVIQITAIA